MANENHLETLLQGVTVWNEWRISNPDIAIDLCMADLSGVDLHKANLSEADLRRANLFKADLSKADLSEANLNEANLYKANLSGALLLETDFHKALLRQADLSEANLNEANLNEADLSDANLRGASLRSASLIKADLRDTNLRETNMAKANLEKAILRGADLRRAILRGADLRGSNLALTTLVLTDLTNANLSGSRIYGISAWDVKLDNTIQTNLDVSPDTNSILTVDNLEMAQFIYLLIHNEKLRYIIDTITSKAVLILGRFSPERKEILDAIRVELRKYDYTPILFDFEKPSSRDLTETVMTLAGMAHFVIADLSDPNSIPHELMSFAEKLLSVPVQVIFSPVAKHENEYPMFKDHFWRYPHVLPVYRYEDQESLIDALYEKVIKPAEDKVKEMKPRD